MAGRKRKKAATHGGIFPALIPLGIGLASAIAGAVASKGMDVIDRKISGKGARKSTRKTRTISVRV